MRRSNGSAPLRFRSTKGDRAKKHTHHYASRRVQIATSMKKETLCHDHPFGHLPFFASHPRIGLLSHFGLWVVILLLGCGHHAGEKADEEIAKPSSPDRYLPVYEIYLEAIDEHPLRISDDKDIIRLHHVLGHNQARTYSISRQRGKYISWDDGTREYTGDVFVLYTKAQKHNDRLAYSINTSKVDGQFVFNWKALTAYADSLGILMPVDSSFLGPIGAGPIFVLEMKMDSTYREAYSRSDIPASLDVFAPIHEAFKKLCPPALELD